MRTEQPAEILAPREGDGYYKTRGLQWLTHCPHINPSGKIALQLLCSLVSDDKPVRLITLEEIGKLLPSGKPVAVGEEPKYMSASNVAVLLEGLSAVGQVVTPEGTPVKVSRKKKTPLRLMPYRYPRHACDCSRNAHDALARIREEEPRWPLAGASGEAHSRQDQDSGPTLRKDQNLGPKDQDFGPKDQNSAQNLGLTCDDAPFLKSFPQSSPLSGVTAATAAPAVSAGAATNERETKQDHNHAAADAAAAEARSEHPVDVPEQRSAQEPPGVDQVVDSYLTAHMASTGMPPRPKAVQEVRAAAAALLSVGRSVDNLCGLVAELAAKGWTDLGKHAAMNPEAPARSALSLKPWCGECNDGREPTAAAQRMVETPTGMAKCLCHPGYLPQPVNA